VQHSVPHSLRARAAWSSGKKREMMMGRALAGSMRSMRVTPLSLLIGNDVRRKIASDYIVRRYSTDKATIKDKVLRL